MDREERKIVAAFDLAEQLIKDLRSLKRLSNPKKKKKK